MVKSCSPQSNEMKRKKKRQAGQEKDERVCRRLMCPSRLESAKQAGKEGMKQKKGFLLSLFLLLLVQLTAPSSGKFRGGSRAVRPSIFKYSARTNVYVC
jgi:hypothetical protein